jgi:hypothetical protein
MTLQLANVTVLSLRGGEIVTVFVVDSMPEDDDIVIFSAAHPIFGSISGREIRISNPGSHFAGSGSAGSGECAIAREFTSLNRQKSGFSYPV